MALLVEFIIDIRHLYRECITIVIMCHNKDPDHPGMEWMAGAVEQVLTRCQLTIRKKYGAGGKAINQGEVWGILYLDAKTTPGWDNNAHPPVWLQPIATMAARIAFQGKENIMASDNNQIPSAFGNMSMLCDRHIKPVADYAQIKGEQAFFLVGEPVNGCNFGLYIVPKTSEEARQRGGSNTHFDNISNKYADQLLMEAAERVTIQNTAEPWTSPTNLFEAAAQEEWKAWHSLALSYRVESTNDIVMMIIALAITTIANFYPANDPIKRTAKPKGIPEDIWREMEQHCDWAQVGSEQAAMGLIRAATTQYARVITLPGSTVMTNKLPKMFRSQVNGRGYNVYSTMMPAFFHAYESAKDRLRQFNNLVLKPTYAESLRGADTFTDAYKGILIPSQFGKSRGVDNCYRIRHAKDKSLENIASMITCKKCLCPNFDLITLIVKDHTMCPRCQAPTEMTKDLIATLTDRKKVIDEVIPTLVRNGIIPDGPIITTWRLPIAPDVEVRALSPTRFDNQILAWAHSAPRMATEMAKRKEKIMQSANTDPVGITRNLILVQLPRPIRITDLTPWDEASLQNPVYMKTLHKEGMSTSELQRLLIPPELTKHIQCGDWSDIGNTSDQVCPSAWSRFYKHALCT